MDFDKLLSLLKNKVSFEETNKDNYKIISFININSSRVNLYFKSSDNMLIYYTRNSRDTSSPLNDDEIYIRSENIDLDEFTNRLLSM